jgi:DNA helicase-2/ATP-dependent DNA helicase PcrA
MLGFLDMSEPVRPGSGDAAIVTEEEQLHARVQARIALGDREREPSLVSADLDRELLTLRDAIAEAKPEDLASLVEQMTRLAALRDKMGGAVRSAPVDPASPYFAHMALVEDGRRREVLVGKRGFVDRESGVNIVDWRNAPISQVYYRYEEGDDYDEEIAGRRLHGLVQVRRNISIMGAKLRRIGAPQGTFVRDAHGVWHVAAGDARPQLRGGSGSAARAPVPEPPKKKGSLGVHHGPIHRPDKHLPEIAALIDREQFDLVTRPEAGVLVVQGGAGSGKTTVALHRIAYLSFADKQRFAPKRILFVVPTKSLARYVADVLPSLGVQGVPVVTYADWAQTARRRLLDGSSKKYNADVPDAVARLKKHPAMLGLLEQVVADQVAAAEAELAAEVGALPGGDAVLSRWRDAGASALVPRLRGLYRWVHGEPAELPAPTRHAAESLITRLGKRADDIQATWAEALTSPARIEAAFARWGDLSGRDLAQLVARVARQHEPPPEAPVDDDGQRIAAIDDRDLDEDDPAGRFDEEDDPLLLRLCQLLRGGLVDRQMHMDYEHVAIDEAQDRSAIEVKVLLEATAGKPAERSVTIAGDTAQRLVFDNAFRGWQDLLELTGHAAQVTTLRLSYRSTAQVMEVARAILGPDLAPAEPLSARSGAPVELHVFGDMGEAVAFLGDALRQLGAREPTASTAVIARYPEQADAIYQGLVRAEVAALRRVRAHDFSFAPGIDVTDVAQVKGLEFDYVVVVEANAASFPDSVESRHLLHIAVTRAAHQLWIVATGAPTALLPAHLAL